MTVSNMPSLHANLINSTKTYFRTCAWLNYRTSALNNLSTLKYLNKLNNIKHMKRFLMVDKFVWPSIEKGNCPCLFHYYYILNWNYKQTYLLTVLCSIRCISATRVIRKFNRLVDRNRSRYILYRKQTIIACHLWREFLFPKLVNWCLLLTAFGPGQIAMALNPS